MQLGYSGVISTVVAGLICGNYGAKRGMAPSVRLAVNTFWEYIGFALNSLVFLLVGLTIRLPDLLRIGDSGLCGHHHRPRGSHL